MDTYLPSQNTWRCRRQISADFMVDLLSAASATFLGADTFPLSWGAATVKEANRSDRIHMQHETITM